ncbi:MULTISPECIES: BatD family protein [Pirellulaceae]|nr:MULTISPECIES: BatD family protein [Pirellulaceae]
MNLRTISQALLAAATIAVCSAAAQAADVRAELSAREAYVGAPISLYLKISDAPSHGEPSLPEVDGLAIRSSGTPSRSTQTTIVNGRRSDHVSTTYSWQITPRREGTFVIPPIQVDVDGQWQSTRPIRFVATKNETGDLLFAEVTGQQKEIYVGQPLSLTLNLWVKPYHDAQYDITLSEENMWQLISEATNWGAFTERMNELAENRQRPGGDEVLREDSLGEEHAYYHYQVETLIYPTRPGKITVDDLNIVVDYPTQLGKSRDPFASMFDNDYFGGRSPFGTMGHSPFRRSSLAITDSRPIVAEVTIDSIDVKPVPTAGRPADYRGTVGQYQIVTQASPTTVKAGDPITLHIGIRGDGPMELVQAPPLETLPQLTADFKVTKEPLAGIVQDDTKLFTTTIRPRRAGITHIPAIPLSYFDPKAETFVTVESKPIAIEVTEAERLQLDAIVSSVDGDNSLSAKGGSQPVFDLTNYTGNDAIVSAGHNSNLPWIVAVVLPPTIVCISWAARNRKSISQWFFGEDRESFRAARRSIETASSPSAIAAVLNRFASSESDNITQSEDLELRQLLNDCDHASYGGSPDQQLSTLKSQAIAIIDQRSKMAPKHNNGTQIPKIGRRRMTAMACWTFAGIALMVPVAMYSMGKVDKTGKQESASRQIELSNSKSSPLNSLSKSQMEIIFDEANRAYLDGKKVSATDTAVAKECFSRAATKYDQLIQAGICNANLYTNLGNVQLQLGSRGKAIANYERSLAVDAFHAQARNNLVVARKSLSTDTHDATTSLGSLFGLGSVERFVSTYTIAILLVAAWAIAWMAVLSSLLLNRLHSGLASFSLCCLLLAGLVVIYFSGFERSSVPRAIVATDKVILREAPGNEFPEIASTTVVEGESLRVLRADGPWIRIEKNDGTSGWIAGTNLEIL